MPRSYLAWAVALCCVLVAPPALAERVGAAMDVAGRAILETGGKRYLMKARMPVSSGDVIVTESNGTVQLVFADRTRIVIGPASRFVVKDVQMAGRSKASKFAVEAVSGTYRFLSGDSDKKAYSIATPTATMGIRGTEFDFAVRRGQPTSLVTFRGQVQICGGRSCARVSGGCAVVQASQRSGIRVPADRTARDRLLVGDHPFVLSQKNLGRQFRTRIRSCGKVQAVVVPQGQVPVRVVPVVEAPPPPPPPPPPSAGYPGQSGSSAEDGSGPSQGDGHVNSVDSGGKGKGHGKDRTGGNGNSRKSK